MVFKQIRQSIAGESQRDVLHNILEEIREAIGGNGNDDNDNDEGSNSIFGNISELFDKDRLDDAKSAFREFRQQALDNGASGFKSFREGASAFFSTLFDGISIVTKLQLALGGIVAVATISYAIFDACTTSAEEANEAVKELMSEYKKAKNTLDSHRQNISGLSSQYKELSSGVNNLGENVSLTSEQYEEYQDVCNQIADMYPNLVQGYDEQGNAILKLKDNVNLLTEAYKEEQKAAYKTLISGTEDGEYNADSIVEAYKILNDSSYWDKFWDFGEVDAGGSISKMDARDAINEFLQLSYEQFQTDFISDGSDNLYDELSSAKKQYLSTLGVNAEIKEEDFAELRSTLKAEMAVLQTEIDQGTQNMRSLAEAFLVVGDDYDKMDDDVKRIASSIVNNLSEETLAQFETSVDLGDFVNSITGALVENPNISESLEGLFNIDLTSMGVGLARDTIDIYINAIIKELGSEKGEKVAQAIKDILGINDLFELDDIKHNSILQISRNANKNKKTATQKNELKDILKDDTVSPTKKHQNLKKELNKTSIDLKRTNDYQKLKKYTMDFTEEEVNLWLEVTKGAKSATEAIALYEQALKDKNEALLESMSYEERLSKVQSSSDDWDLLDEIYADVYNKEDFDWSSILNNEDFKEAFGEYEKEYEDFIKTISNSPNDLQSCQSAFNDLATAYIYSKAGLESVTEETKESTIAMLEQYGVSNAATLVEAQLTAKIYARKVALEEVDFANEQATASLYNEISGLVNESEASKIACSALFELIAKQNIFANQSLNTVSKIRELEKLAKAYGITAASAYTVADVNRELRNAEIRGKNITREEVENDLLNKYYNSINKSITASFGDLDANYTGGTKTNEEKEKNDSDSDSDTAEQFDFIEIKIQRGQEALDGYKNKAENTFDSMTNRVNNYSSAIQQSLDLISLYNQAYDAYQKERDAVGLDEHWASQVRDGSLNIAEVSDEDTKEKIQKYTEFNDKMNEIDANRTNEKLNNNELVRNSIEMIVTKNEQLISSLESKNSRISKKIEIKEILGLFANNSDYNKMNNNIQKQIKYNDDLLVQLKKLQETVPKNSEEWRNYQSRIDDTTASTQELTASMIKNAQTKAALASEKADKKVEKLDSKNELTDAKIESAGTAIKKNSLIDKKVSRINSKKNYYNSAYKSSSNSLNIWTNKLVNKNNKQTNTNDAYINKENEAYNKVLAKVKKQVQSNKKIGYSLLAEVQKVDDDKLSLWTACINYNSYYDANQKNKDVVELNAITLQKEKASLREEQLKNNLDKNQKTADRSTLSAAESLQSKNHNINVEVNKAKADQSSNTTARKKATKDRKNAGVDAKFSYKKAKGNLKKRLKAVMSAIKSGKEISKDGLKAVKEYCNEYLKGNLTYYYNCESYNMAVQNELTAKETEVLAKAETYSTKHKAGLDKIQNTIDDRNSKNDLYALKSENATKIKDKNSYVNKQIKNISSNQKTYNDSYTELNKTYLSSKKKVENTTSKNKDKQKIINDIKTKFTSKGKLISDKYLTKAMTVSNKFWLACKKYNEDLEAKNTAKATAEMYEESSKQEKAALALEKINNIETHYDNQRISSEQKKNSINNQISLVEAEGKTVSIGYYDALMAEEEVSQNSLLAEREAMLASLNDSISKGHIEIGSQSYYDAISAINNVTAAYEEGKTTIQEYENAKRQIRWDAFDKGIESIKRINSEADYYISLMSNEKLIDEDTGDFTEYGTATLALQKANMENYFSQAKEFKKQYDELLADIANGQESLDDENVVAELRRLEDGMRDATLAAKDQEQAIIDLIRQGYDAQLNALNELIEKYKELKNSEKD